MRRKEPRWRGDLWPAGLTFLCVLACVAADFLSAGGRSAAAGARGSLPPLPTAIPAGAEERGGGACHPKPTCTSKDPTNSAGCYKHMSDAELELLLGGAVGLPLEPPVVCGQSVETPEEARAVLASGGPSPCERFRRQALAAIFNIRRSLLFGDGKLGDDGAGCFGVGWFRIVLRCGSAFVPDPETPDPSDALAVTYLTPISRLIEAASTLCELASCPPTNTAPCGKTIGKIADILDRVNTAKSREGDCGLCPGDRTPPAIQCPAGPLVFECEGTGGAAIDYRVTATDNCDPRPHVSCYPPPGTVLPVGSVRTVECVAVDLAGNVATCSFEVQVVDRTPPAIFCPPEPIVVDCVPGPGGNGAVVNYPLPAAADLCDAAPSVSANPPSGSFFPLGVTTVECVAVDASGNAATCSFEVHVVEETPPELYCPGDVEVECQGPEGTVVEYPPPMLSETCDGPEDPVCDVPSGSLFPLGTTTVTCRARSPSGAEVSCSFDVTVRDATPPAISCPQDMVVECGAPSGTPVFFEVTARDACDAEVAVACDPPSGSLFPVGETNVACSAVDSSGNVSTCSFRVIVADTTPPEITCPQGPVRVDCLIVDGAPGAIANFPDPLVSDLCDPHPAVEADRPSGSFFPLGTTTVTFTATDCWGNRSECSFEVHVVDETPPQLVCIEDATVECQGPEGAFVEYPIPLVADECDLAPLVSLDPPPGSLFPMGATTVSAVAADASGNEVSCSFEVRVVDATPPTISCPGDRLVECAGPEGTVVEFSLSASDLCDADPVVYSIPPSGSVFPVGVTVVDCFAVDSAGNLSSCRFNVSVVDTAPPEISCPDEIRVESQSPEGTPVAFSASAFDACGGAVDVTSEPPSGSLFPLGETVVNCTAVDSSGNRSSKSFSVFVVDTTPPVLSCPPEAIAIECTGENAARALYPLPGVTDNGDPNPALVCDPPPGTLLPLGTYVVVCTATDASGNSASCSFELKIVDTAAPGLNCPGDVVLEASGPEGAALSYDLPTPADTCDPAPNLACVPAPGTVFPIGTSVVACTADDSAGNMIRCEFEVRVVDTTPPVLHCPGDVVVDCSGPGGTQVNFEVRAEDLVDPSPAIASEPPSGSAFPIGTTEVRATATDRYGNSSYCVFRVTVRDATPPEISCPADFETACVEGGTALVEYPPPSVADGCDPAPVVECDPPSGSRLPLGTHAIRCTATDASGNRSSCEFSVRVVDEAPPALVCPPDLTVECEGPSGTVVDYPLPKATDSCDGERPVTCTPPPGSLFQAGETEVVCESSDASGNVARCTFLVTVRDATPPRILCPEEVIAEQTSPEGARVDFQVSVEDSCDPSATLAVDPPSGSLFPPGRTMVVSRAVDASGNVSECSFPVSVVDRTPPELTCPADMIALGTTAGNPAQRHEDLRWPPQEGPPKYAVTAVVTYDLPVARDAAQAEPPQVTATPPPGTRLELGTHVVTVRARDLAGNESTCTFQVTVIHGLHAFIRADTNLDARLDIADPIWTVNYLFSGGPKPLCFDAADANDDGTLNLSDAIYSLNYSFHGGPPPPEPFFPLCGLDPTEDALTCERYYPCE